MVIAIDVESGSSEGLPELKGDVTEDAVELTVCTGDVGRVSIESLELFLVVDESFRIKESCEVFLDIEGVRSED